MQAHEPHLLAKTPVMIPVVSANFQAQFTTATLTPDILEKIGVQVQTGLASLGKTLKETFQGTLQPVTTTVGTQTRQRSSSQFPMKGQRTETRPNKPMTKLRFKKHTTTVSLQASSLSVFTDKDTAERVRSNLTSWTWFSVQTALSPRILVTVQETHLLTPIQVAKHTSSHQEAVPTKWPFSLKPWSTFLPTTLVKST